MSSQNFNSQENPHEMYFSWYLDELKHNGYIKYYDREPEIIRVMPAYSYKREKHYKVKDNVQEEFTLLNETNYRYDYRIVWEYKARYIFTDILEKDGSFRFGEPTFISHWIDIHGDREMVSYIDVKPHMAAAKFGGKLSTFYTFPYVQKILLMTRGLYINKTIPVNSGKHGVNTCLFAKTFTPNRYYFTDAGQQQRKIKWKKTSFKAYVKVREGIIDGLLSDIKKKGSKYTQEKLL